MTKSKGSHVKKQVDCPNPTGKGGFGDHPENINTDGRTDNPWTWRELFIKIAEEKKGKLTRKEIAARAQWKNMEKGDVKAFEKIADRMEGKPMQKGDLHVTGSLSLTDVLDAADE